MANITIVKSLQKNTGKIAKKLHFLVPLRYLAFSVKADIMYYKY